MPFKRISNLKNCRFSFSLLSILVGLGLLLFWGLIFYYTQVISTKVPTHFTIQSSADAFGDISSLYWLGIINTVLVVLVLAFKSIPHSLYFGTKDNAVDLQKMRPIWKNTMNLLALSIIIIAYIVLFETVGYQSDEPAYSFIAIFFVIKIPIFYYFYSTQNLT